MYQNHRIAVVVPAHNEASHISSVLRNLPEWVDHIVVVDDASLDGTSEAALKSGDRRLDLIRNSKNLGVGGSMLAGYRKALELGADIVVKMDGDDQMPPEYLPALLKALLEEGMDYAKGNRFLAGESLQKMPRLRLFGNIVLTFLNKLASGYWNVFDPQNGFTAVKSSVLKRLEFKSFHLGYFFENDMLIHLNLLNCRVKDVAVPARYGDEKSDLNPFKIGVSFPLLLMRRFAYRIYQKYILRDFSPIAMFLILGSLLFAWGFGFGAYLWLHTRATGLPTPTGTIMLSLLPLILGFQLLLQAIVLDIQETPK
ncbi:glycosyltransferase family 2 protein [Deltaproteobacteria bacterium PRO3]|nr:glycosyltransferase family 2 protein [Deltaproteobacteria bacterium PRO3]